MLLFSFSIFSDRRLLKIENENNSTKSAMYRTRVPRVQYIDIENYPGWLDLPLIGTNFHGHKPVGATEALLILFLSSIS